jgi:cation transport ATPase
MDHASHNEQLGGGCRADWLLSPMSAALAMSLSSASVIGNALRLRSAGSR